jgi:hypothetical protein
MSDISKIYVGSNLVLASGVVVVRQGVPVVIVPLPTVSQPLQIRVEFDDANQLLPPQVSTQSVAGNIMVVTIRNFSNLTGTVAANAVGVGAIGGRPLFLDLTIQHFVIASGILSSTLKTFTYTITIAGTQDVS